MNQLSAFKELFGYLTVLLFCSGLTGPLSAHDDIQPELKPAGFVFRADVGLGSASFERAAENGLSAYSLSGFSGEFRLVFGGALRADLILYGSLGGFVLSDPSYTVAGKEVPLGDDNSFGLNMYSAGVLFYPAGQWTLSFDAGAARNIFVNKGRENFSDIAAGFRLAAGYEWPVIGDDGALGLELFSIYAPLTISNRNRSAALTNLHFGLAFTVSIY